MALSVSMQRIKHVRTQHYETFSTVHLCNKKEWFSADADLYFFFNGETHRKAARLVAKIIAECEGCVAELEAEPEVPEAPASGQPLEQPLTPPLIAPEVQENADFILNNFPAPSGELEGVHRDTVNRDE